MYYVIITHKGLKYRFLSSFKGKLSPNDFFVKIKSNLTVFIFLKEKNSDKTRLTVVGNRFLLEFTVKCYVIQKNKIFEDF